MTFNKKIIVFEDIDCIGDIILERKMSETRIKILVVIVVATI